MCTIIIGRTIITRPRPRLASGIANIAVYPFLPAQRVKVVKGSGSARQLAKQMDLFNLLQQNVLGGGGDGDSSEEEEQQPLLEHEELESDSEEEGKSKVHDWLATASRFHAGRNCATKTLIF